mgnify:CR=1 FL=1
MADPKGFLKYNRELPTTRSPQERVKDYKELYNEFSSEKTKEQSARCMDCGMNDYVTKPFNAKELQLRIQNIIQFMENLSAFCLTENKLICIKYCVLFSLVSFIIYFFPS